MRALILSAVNPDNTPHGYNWTFAFPMLLFIVIALILWALFGRPHQRVPARRLAAGLGSRGPDSGTAMATSVGGGASGAHLTAGADAPDAGGAEEDGDEPPAGESASGAAGASE